MRQLNDVKALSQNVFSMIGDQWMLVTAGTPQHCNTMTASWGGLGVLWGKNVATIYIRPQRYTMEFISKSEHFTLSFFGAEHRDALSLCGAKSGRDVDKIKECGLTVESSLEQAPYFAAAELVLVCKKLYCQAFDPNCFTVESLDAQYYPGKDYHNMLIGEITEALIH